MISGVSSSNVYQNVFQASSTKSSSLTDDQKAALQSIISKYDSSNMTDSSTKAMMDEIQKAGITPGKEFGDIMNAAGFKPPEKPDGPPPPPPIDGTSSTSSSSGTTSSGSTTSTSTTTLPDYLQSFLTKQESGSVSQDDIASLIQSLLGSGQSTTGSIVDSKG